MRRALRIVALQIAANAGDDAAAVIGKILDCSNR
ncbi:hypothetical protein RGCCGE502_29333 (plasmid) [Rhizobium grahamii CCGE 502]|uniref:Uncharacterized protein n=1 Tax=Rhizobium grahamii CCGE 502 TaxID=990285 RepID=S3I577_9HYPH|nr:hypothetical protein RGCCGE502_29333 [Rhizobium grahamii CCGE 502]